MPTVESVVDDCGFASFVARFDMPRSIERLSDFRKFRSVLVDSDNRFFRALRFDRMFQIREERAESVERFEVSESPMSDLHPSESLRSYHIVTVNESAFFLKLALNPWFLAVRTWASAG